MIYLDNSSEGLNLHYSFDEGEKCLKVVQSGQSGNKKNWDHEEQNYQEHDHIDNCLP